MATELPAGTPPAIKRNPFRRSQAEPTLTYIIDGRKEHINPSQYRDYQKLFAKYTQDSAFIQDEKVVEILQRSKLTEEVLGDLWEHALKATFSSAVTVEARLGFLNRDEFFVLLSEFQAKAGISDERFSETFLGTDGLPQTRRNPFKKVKTLEDPIPIDESLEAMSEPVDAAKREVISPSGGLKEPAKEGVESMREAPVPSQELSLVDPYLDMDSVISPLSPVTSSGLFPSPVTPANVRKDDKEVVHRPRALKSSDHNYPPLEPVAQTPKKVFHSSAGTRSGEIEVVGPTTDNKEVRLGAVDFTSSKEVNTHIQVPRSDENQQQLVLHASLRRPPDTDSHDLVEVEAPVATSTSDELALERLAVLQAKEPQLPPRPEKKQSLSRRLLTKAHLSKSSSPGLVSTGSGTGGSRFSLRLLSQVLHDAATEGDLPLVGSLFKLGVNVNYSSLDPPKHHHILGAAAVSEHTHIVDYFILMGADETSIYQAFATAFYDGHLEMAIRIVPHVNIYALKPIANSSKDTNILICLLGQVARNMTVTATDRERILEVMIDQKQFSATRIVYEIREKKAPSEVREKKTQTEAPQTINDIRASYNVTQLLISRLDVGLVKKITTRLGNTPPDRACSDWLITAEEWQRNPQRALEMLQLLITQSVSLDNKTKSQERMEMTPLGHAVAGGSLEGVKRLLELNADPECLIYEPSQDGSLSTDAYTALGWAAKQGRVDLCRQLVDAGAIPWRTGAFNQTPLYWASKHGHLEVVQYLLSLDTKRSSIDSCLVASIEGNEPKIAKLLLENGASVTPDTWEATMSCQPKPLERSKHLEIINLLLSKPSERLHGEAIACAINSKNFAGLSRVLENWNDDLSSETFLPRCYIHRAGGGKMYSCVKYAEHKGALDFVSLLKNYRWSTEQKYEGL